MSKNLISKDIFTVGLPTYKPGMFLVDTVRSLRASEGVEKDFIINVYADGGVEDPAVKEALKPFNVNLIEGNPRVGQTAGNKKLANMTNTEVYIQTQEDVLFEPHTLALLVQAFLDDPEVTMAVPCFLPLKPAKTKLEAALGLGQEIRNEISITWKDGDNYLTSIGRCLAFRTKTAQNFDIADSVINCDAYYYFNNRKLGGKYKLVKDAVVRFRVPQKMADHLKQVRKFVVSNNELDHYFKSNLAEDYSAPLGIKVKATIKKALRHPLLFAYYLYATFYSRTRPKEFYKEVSLFWEVDESTKQL